MIYLDLILKVTININYFNQDYTCDFVHKVDIFDKITN